MAGHITQVSIRVICSTTEQVTCKRSATGFKPLVLLAPAVRPHFDRSDLHAINVQVYARTAHLECEKKSSRSKTDRIQNDVSETNRSVKIVGSSTTLPDSTPRPRAGFEFLDSCGRRMTMLAQA